MATARHTIAVMMSDLDALGTKIGMLADIAARLRADNAALRQQVAQQELELNAMRARMNEARVRLESVVQRLPAELTE